MNVPAARVCSSPSERAANVHICFGTSPEGEPNFITHHVNLEQIFRWMDRRKELLKEGIMDGRTDVKVDIVF